MPARSYFGRPLYAGRRWSACVRPHGQASVASVGAGLLPLVDIGLGDCLDRQDLVLWQRLAVEVIRDHLGRLEPGAGRHLRSSAVLLAGLDPGNALLEAIAADDDQFALLDAERNARRFRGLHDGGGLVVGHTVDDVEPALGRKSREQLAGDALAEVGLPLGVLDGDDLSLRIGLHGLAEAGDPARADTLLQRAGDERDLAAVAAALLERLQYRYPCDAAELDVVLADEAEVEVLGAVAGWGVDQDHRHAGLLGADQRRHDSLLGAGNDGQHVELAGDGVVDLLRLQGCVEMLADRIDLHAE